MKIALPLLAFVCAVTVAGYATFQPFFWQRQFSPTMHGYFSVRDMILRVGLLSGTAPFALTVPDQVDERDNWPLNFGNETEVCLVNLASRNALRGRGMGWHAFDFRIQQRLPRNQAVYQTQLRSWVWTPVILSLAWLAVAYYLGPLRRRCRKRLGLCLRCAYNLAGNTSGVCPECGTQT